MFCTQCGSNIPDGSKFCHVCGAEQIRPEINQQSVQQEQQEASKSGKKGLIIGISILTTIIVAVAIVLIVLNPFKKDEKAADKTTESVADSTVDNTYKEASDNAYITNVVVNTSENDTTTNMEKISIDEERYYHFELQGLKDGEEIELNYTVDKTNGNTTYYDLHETYKNGDIICIKYFDYDANNTGVETVNVKRKDTKEVIGSISVKIVYNVTDVTENTTESEEKKDNDDISDAEAVTAKEFTDIPLIFLQKGTDSAGVHYQLGTPHHTEISNGYLYEFFEYEYSGINGTIYVAYPEDNDIFAFGLWTNININDATVDARNDDTVFVGRFNDDLSRLEGSIKTSTGAEQSYFYDESGVKSIGYENKDNGNSIWITYNNNTGKIEVGIFYLD